MASCEDRIQQPFFLSHVWNLLLFSSQFIQWSHLVLSVWNHSDCLSSSLSSFLSLVGLWRCIRTPVHPFLRKYMTNSFWWWFILAPLTSISICVPDFCKNLVLGEVIDLNEERPMIKASNDFITKDSDIRFLPSLWLFTAYIFWLSSQSSASENGKGVCTWEESTPCRGFQQQEMETRVIQRTWCWGVV